MKKQIIIIAVFCGMGFSNIINAQSSEKNLAKYWSYRKRLLRRF